MARKIIITRAFMFVMIFCGTVFWVSGVSHSDILAIQPGTEGKDAGVSYYDPSANNGNTEWYNGIGLIGYYAAFVEFDLSSIPEGSSIASATITLWGAYKDGSIYFSPALSSWDEMSVTWNNQPSDGPPNISYPISRGDPNGGCYWGCEWEFDITDIVQYWMENPNFGLKIEADTPGIGWLMASSDNLTHPTPRLDVEYSTVDSGETSWGAVKGMYR